MAWCGTKPLPVPMLTYQTICSGYAFISIITVLDNYILYSLAPGRYGCYLICVTSESPASRLITQPLFRLRSKRTSNSAPLAFVRRIHPVTCEFPAQRGTRKCFHLMTSSWFHVNLFHEYCTVSMEETDLWSRSNRAIGKTMGLHIHVESGIVGWEVMVVRPL